LVSIGAFAKIFRAKARKSVRGLKKSRRVAHHAAIFAGLRLKTPAKSAEGEGMAVDTSSAVSGVESGQVDQSYSVRVLRKAQDAQRLQGAEAVRLIDESGPQMTKTEDGHISVRA
jgi:hypothetical protein